MKKPAEPALLERPDEGSYLPCNVVYQIVSEGIDKASVFTISADLLPCMTAICRPISHQRTGQDDRKRYECSGEQPSNRRSGDPTAGSTTRDLRLDFFRGLALIFIFVDHIPENVLSYFTLQAFQFFDAAEVFIFVSGYTAAFVYGRTLALHGTFYGTAQILRRVWQLYVAHVFLFMIFIAEVSYTVTTFNNPM